MTSGLKPRGARSPYVWAVSRNLNPGLTTLASVFPFSGVERAPLSLPFASRAALHRDFRVTFLRAARERTGRLPKPHRKPEAPRVPVYTAPGGRFRTTWRRTAGHASAHPPTSASDILPVLRSPT